jgi:agmatine deiminase
LWLGYPSHSELWESDLEAARAEVGALARALAGPGGERVKLLVSGEEASRHAHRELGREPSIEITGARFGDIWLRDTGPIFFERAAARAHAFQWNGWGEKYVLAHDDEVAEQIAVASGVRLERFDFILEGGAVEHDGLGTVLTTRQCLLNPNRNPGWDEHRAEEALGRALGAKKVLWLDQGLENDHTDGHIDNLARFLAPGLVACPSATGPDDPNAAVYDEIATALGAMTDATGASLRVVRIPSPGKITDDRGAIVPASHMNFVIANLAVVVPLYGEPAGRLALGAIARHCPDRQVIGLSSRAILHGGGSFHCICQQEPA